MLLSVVAPESNEEAIVQEFFCRVSAVLNGNGEQWELILVNDGSRDRSPELIREIHRLRRKRVKVIGFTARLSATR